MLRAILQTQRQQDSRWMSSPLPPGGKQRVACMPRVDSGACLVQPAPGRCPIRRRHGVEQANRRRKRRWTARLARGGRRAVRQCVWQEPQDAVPASRCRSASPKGSTEARGRSDWVSSLNGERFPIGGFAASFAESLQLLVLPPSAAGGHKRTGHTLFFVCCRRRSKQVSRRRRRCQPGKNGEFANAHRG